jgi:hypothetical protein
MPARPRRMLQFSEHDLERIRLCLAATGQTYEEFIEWAVMQALTEIEGYGEAYRQRQAQQRTQAW